MGWEAPPAGRVGVGSSAPSPGKVRRRHCPAVAHARDPWDGPAAALCEEFGGAQRRACRQTHHVRARTSPHHRLPAPPHALLATRTRAHAGRGGYMRGCGRVAADGGCLRHPCPRCAVPGRGRRWLAKGRPVAVVVQAEAAEASLSGQARVGECGVQCGAWTRPLSRALPSGSEESHRVLEGQAPQRGAHFPPGERRVAVARPHGCSHGAGVELGGGSISGADALGATSLFPLPLPLGVPRWAWRRGGGGRRRRRPERAVGAAAGQKLGQGRAGDPQVVSPRGGRRVTALVYPTCGSSSSSGCSGGDRLAGGGGNALTLAPRGDASRRRCARCTHAACAFVRPEATAPQNEVECGSAGGVRGGAVALSVAVGGGVPDARRATAGLRSGTGQ